MSDPRQGPHAVFLDFDGTLGDHGVVPSAHVEAVKQARQAGHYVLLCTGRPEPMVSPDLMDILDGVVCSAGGYVRVRGTVVSDERFPEKTAAKALEILTHHDVPFVLEAPEGVYGNDKGVERLQILLDQFKLHGGEQQPGSLGRGAEDIRQSIRHTPDLRCVRFAKVVIWGSHISTEQFAEEIGPDVRPMPNSVDSEGRSSGELQLWSVDKIDGVRKAAEHLGVPMERTIGCGDGLNDVGMLKGTGQSVVVEGSTAADSIDQPTLVVPGPSKGGIATAFRELGLITQPSNVGLAGATHEKGTS